MNNRAEYVAALHRERQFAVEHGNTKTVADVDAELAKYSDTPQTQTLETAVPNATRTRSRNRPTTR